MFTKFTKLFIFAIYLSIYTNQQRLM